MPTALLRGEVRVAFLGRTSAEDQQDPRQSLIRQLGNCKNTIPMSWVIVAHFYDVESGRMELDRRGQGSGYERFDIPIARDGGIADLLTESRRQERRFDVVICESISRVARRAFEGLSIERALEQADVPLFASNEPITLSGSRAQRPADIADAAGGPARTDDERADCVGAPDGTRTRTESILSRLPLPIGLRGHCTL